MFNCSVLSKNDKVREFLANFWTTQIVPKTKFMKSTSSDSELEWRENIILIFKCERTPNLNGLWTHEINSLELSSSMSLNKSLCVKRFPLSVKDIIHVNGAKFERKLLKIVKQFWIFVFADDRSICSFLTARISILLVFWQLVQWSQLNFCIICWKSVWKYWIILI